MSDRLFSLVFRPDADGLIHGQDKNFAVADLAGLGSLEDGPGGLGHLGVRHDGLELHLGQEVDGVFAATVDLGVALLAAEPLDLRDGHSLDPHFREGFLHLLQLEGLDDRFDFLECHGLVSFLVIPAGPGPPGKGCDTPPRWAPSRRKSAVQIAFSPLSSVRMRIASRITASSCY